MEENGKGSYLMMAKFRGGNGTSITIDSGAEESVCPWEWGKHFGMKTPNREMIFRNASGGAMKHYGRREMSVEPIV